MHLTHNLFSSRTLLTAVSALSVAVLALIPMSAARAQSFLDLTSLTPGSSGSFSGTLNGIAVTGAITVPDTNFTFSPTGTTFDASTIDNSSPQYTYGSVYNPTAPLTDHIGYNMTRAGGPSSATIFVAFGAPITNPVFQVANLDGMQYTFSFTGGLTGLSLLRGNGGGGEGLVVSGAVIADANQSTIIGVAPTTTPPLTGPRSAYGSIQLTGTFQTLTFTASNPTGEGDGGSFTFSTAATAAPETGSLALLLPIVGAIGIVERRRRKK